jgi:hypothetical protein
MGFERAKAATYLHSAMVINSEDFGSCVCLSIAALQKSPFHVVTKGLSLASPV